MERYLIVNADDFGSSAGANNAVDELFNTGWVTSTTLMTPCDLAGEALALARANPKMNVGLHLTTNAEWESSGWRPLTGAPSLTDERGWMHRTVAAFAATAYRAEVVAELEAQMAFMVSRHCPPDHVDNHMGSLYGLGGSSFLPEVLTLCKARGLPFRLPRNLTASMGPVPESVGVLHREAVALADQLGVGLPNVLLSFPRRLTETDDYSTVRDTYLALLGGIGEGITEVYLHPCLYSPASVQDMGETSARQRGWEYEFLKDKEARDVLLDAGIQLVSWKTAPFDRFR